MAGIGLVYGKWRLIGEAYRGALEGGYLDLFGEN